ncbi:hypothetical protein [Agaribacterium haliotis]|uniref:hypothetical protein n=1 Tax=Agaribacterium haliotis TaxID=2013869 RepID=UPI000BB5850D|nr:hypothetical protein [Agaribacterium haliotis]
MSVKIKRVAKSKLVKTSKLLTTLLALQSQTTSAASCEQQAKSQLEHAYCQVQAQNTNSSLPSLQDFKKNSEQVQYLLLKRDARRLGIELVKPALTKTSSTGQYKNNTKRTAASSSFSSASSSAAPLTTPSSARSGQPAPEQLIVNRHRNNKLQDKQEHNKKYRQQTSTLEHCKLNEAQIRCPDARFQLLSNQKNKQLKADAFSAGNQLIFPARHSSSYQQATDHQYLSDIYPHYIDKMLMIGLADSTMSFTKFAMVYGQSKQDKQDFVERFQYMYNKLKIEKSQNGVKARYRNNHPQSIAQCMMLGEKLVVCDDVKQNWVYKQL